MRITEHHAPTARGDAFWLEAGAGWPVVLLHAFPLHADMWRPQLERVPEGWRFIAPDLRGFGRARGLADEPSMDAYAADVCALMDRLAVDEAVIAGLSMGGYVAFALYRMAAPRFTGLVLADTRAAADTPDSRAGRATMRESLAQHGPSAVADAMLPALSERQRVEGPKLLSERADAAIVASVRSMIESGDAQGIDAAIVAMMDRRDMTADLPHIACATLVVAGAGDIVTPPAAAESMQRAIPRSTLTVIGEAGHLSNLEQPDQFSRVLADFLLARL
jgi:pimeloyl-ACP methyl ester carboxylesterase